MTKMVNELDTLTKELNNLVIEAGNAVSEYEKALRSDSVVALAKAEAAAKESVKALNEKKIAHTYESWLQTENPVDTAVRTAYIAQYSIKVTEDKNTGVKSATLECGVKTTVVDLVALMKRAGRLIVPNGQWIYYAERACMMFNRLATAGIGGDLKRFDSKYRVSSEALGLNINANVAPHRERGQV